MAVVLLIDKTKDSVTFMHKCTCRTSILTALWALSDWAEVNLQNFRRELKGELKPLDGPTNRRHVKELRRFQRDFWLGIWAVKNCSCNNPLILRHFSELDRLHEMPLKALNDSWTKALRSEQFVRKLIALVSRLLSKARRCKKDIQRELMSGAN
jgi:hypothetical protein